MLPGVIPRSLEDPKWKPKKVFFEPIPARLRLEKNLFGASKNKLFWVPNGTQRNTWEPSGPHMIPNVILESLQVLKCYSA